MSRRRRLVLSGTPLVLDTAFRPLARVAQVFLGTVGTVLAGWFGGLWWAPVPLAVSFLIYEVYFWWRGDRPIRLTLDDTVSAADRIAGRHHALHLDDIHAVTFFRRPREPHRDELVVLLASRTQVEIALQLLVEPDVPSDDSVVPIPVLDALLGGVAGVIRSTAPPDARVRQTIDDPRGQVQAWLRANLPPEVFQRTTLRLWRGEAPPLDLFGLHVGPADAQLVVDGDTWTLTDEHGTREGVLASARSAYTTRWVTLARRFDTAALAGRAEAIPTDELELPLLVLTLADDLSLVLPAPTLDLEGTPLPPDPAWLHTHLAEGGALVWHLLRRWPPSAWPSALRPRATQLLQPSAPPSSRPRHPSRP